jgi:hypothetical protein
MTDRTAAPQAVRFCDPKAVSTATDWHQYPATCPRTAAPTTRSGRSRFGVAHIAAPAPTGATSGRRGACAGGLGGVGVTKIYSIAGLLPPGMPLIRHRPFRAPHHTISHAGLVGGGHWPRPGEISLAHRGVLFLDELPEFGTRTLEGLRQPLEDGVVSISRAAGTLAFPARFMFIAAMNPCPCGYYGDPVRECTCSLSTISRYQKRISGPLGEDPLPSLVGSHLLISDRRARYGLWWGEIGLC